MKKLRLSILIFGSIVIFAIAAGIFVYRNYNSNRIKNFFSESQQTFETQTNSEGLITFQVTPKYASTSSTLDFEITLTAHSGNLNQDLTKDVVLVDDNGNQFTPISWEGNHPGGHHRTGILKFKSLGKNQKSITLKINPGENIKEVNFTWQLERT